jgi:hyperosmotically inducible periplasmic protein
MRARRLAHVVADALGMITNIKEGTNMNAPRKSVAVGLLLLSMTGAVLARPQKQDTPKLGNPTTRSLDRTTTKIVDEVRHQLVTLPYYSAFDWIEGQVLPDASVTLRGQVTRPTTKTDAESRVKSLENVSRVIDQIEVLPLSPSDDNLRRILYRELFNYNSPLFEYALQAVPPIHIIVKNGHVTLKGVVANQMDRQLAETRARSVPGVFDVTNQLTVAS